MIDESRPQRGSPGAMVVWDLPVRIVHWSLALALPALWWTAEQDEMGWHMRIGIAVLVLVVFRVIWGFVGSSTARFANFVRGPRQVFAYLRGKTSHACIGHNSAGAYSVLLLLGLVTLQVALGLFSGDIDDGVAGPLNELVSSDAADSASDAHEAVFYLILAAVALHLAAIAFYRLFRRENLVAPMVTGRRRIIEGTDSFIAAPRWRALVSAMVAVSVAGWIWAGAPTT